MKNSVELRQDRADLIKKAGELLDTCKSEARDFNTEEQASYDTMMSSIDKMGKDVNTVERQEKLNAEIASKSTSVSALGEEKSDVRSYSIFKAISGFMNNTLDGVEKELHDEAVAEARANGRVVQGLGIPARYFEERTDITQAGSAIAPKAIMSYADALREATVFDKVGANVLTGLAGDSVLPIVGKQGVSWKGEITTGTDQGAQFTKLTLSPKRLTSFVDISKQLLLQNGMGAQNAILSDLGRAAGALIDTAMFASADVSDAPEAIADGGGAADFTEVATYEANVSIYSDFVAAEQELAVNEGLSGNLAYVANPVLMKDLKQSAAVAAVNVGMQGSLVNGYPTYFSNAPAKAAQVPGTSAGSGDFLFGDFSKLYIGMFGGLDIIVDPYTQAALGEVRLVVNQYIDWGVAHGNSFVKGTSLTTEVGS